MRRNSRWVCPSLRQPGYFSALAASLASCSSRPSSAGLVAANRKHHIENCHKNKLDVIFLKLKISWELCFLLSAKRLWPSSEKIERKKQRIFRYNIQTILVCVETMKGLCKSMLRNSSNNTYQVLISIPDKTWTKPNNNVPHKTAKLNLEYWLNRCLLAFIKITISTTIKKGKFKKTLKFSKVVCLPGY